MLLNVQWCTSYFAFKLSMIIHMTKTPWVTPKTKTLMKRRDRLYRKMKKSGNKDLKDKYKHLKHHVQKELRHAYWTYIENIVTPKQDDNSFSNMKKVLVLHQKQKIRLQRSFIIKTRWQTYLRSKTEIKLSQPSISVSLFRSN